VATITPWRDNAITVDVDTPGISVDIVVVSYNSEDTLHDCVAPFSRRPDARVIVVDNDSTDASVASLADLDVTTIAAEVNRGFAAGCNIGYRAGTAPFVLFLNPDARAEPELIGRLRDVLTAAPGAGAVAPRILDEEGHLDYSLRRFPRRRSTFAQALFLHRALPQATWVDEVVRDPAAYEHAWSPDWVSGACLLVRRSVLEQIGGFDEGYFHYSEDTDLCRRIRDAGFDIRYEPSAVVVHLGGRSTPRPALLPTLAAARVRYVRRHDGRAAAELERIGVGLGAATHLAVGRGGMEQRRGHGRALLRMVRGVPDVIDSPNG
jgi:N-acetylglucosaminyl-diphospho-decaprenol L-rhamnosyltransferase